MFFLRGLATRINQCLLGGYSVTRDSVTEVLLKCYYSVTEVLLKSLAAANYHGWYTEDINCAGKLFLVLLLSINDDDVLFTFMIYKCNKTVKDVS